MALPIPPKKNNYGQDKAHGAITYEKFLVPCTWRGIEFPIYSVQTKLEQNLVQHKYPDRDGAHVESTGRDPIRVSVKAIFYNGTSRGKGESWAFGDLYPGVFDRFIAACKNRRVGTLQHPIHGEFDAKCVSASYDLTADRRDGVMVDVEWIETIKQVNDPASQDRPDPSTAAAAVDDELSRAPLPFINALPPALKTFSFLDALNSIKAFIDTASLIGQKALAQINHVIYHINNLLFSIDNANTCLLAALKQKVQLLKAAVHQLKSQVQNTSALLFGYSNYLLTRDMTMGQLVSLLSNDVVTLIKLNMKVAAKPIIPAGTTIRYQKLVG